MGIKPLIFGARGRVGGQVPSSPAVAPIVSGPMVKPLVLGQKPAKPAQAVPGTSLSPIVAAVADPVATMARDTMAAGAAGLAGLGRRVSPHAGAVAGAVVDGLVEAATRAAKRLAPSVSDGQCRAVWADVIEALQECGLAGPDGRVWQVCAKTGRRIGEVLPDFWLSDLAVVARLGNTPSADAAISRLVGCITAQLAFTVSPMVAVQSVASLAMLRESDPVGYLVQGVAECLPLGQRADMVARARRAVELGALRAGLAALPWGAIQYGCEVVGLYLGHVLPARLPGDVNPLRIYDGRGLAGIGSNPAALAHFCGRLVQTIFALIARHRVKPLEHLTRQDLAGLKVHYQGSGLYAAQKQARAILRADLASAENIRSYRMVTIDGRRVRRVMSASDIEAVRRQFGVDSATLDLDLSNLADLQTAARAMGNPVQIQVQTPRELSALDMRRKAARDRAQELLGDDLDTLGGAPDLSELALSGILPDDFAAEFDTEADLISAGLVTLEQVLDFNFDFMAQDDESESDDYAGQDDAGKFDALDLSADDLLSRALSEAIANAKPAFRR